MLGLALYAPSRLVVAPDGRGVAPGDQDAYLPSPFVRPHQRIRGVARQLGAICPEPFKRKPSASLTDTIQ